MTPEKAPSRPLEATAASERPQAPPAAERLTERPESPDPSVAQQERRARYGDAIDAAYIEGGITDACMALADAEIQAATAAVAHGGHADGCSLDTGHIGGCVRGERIECHAPIQQAPDPATERRTRWEWVLRDWDTDPDSGDHLRDLADACMTEADAELADLKAEVERLRAQLGRQVEISRWWVNCTRETSAEAARLTDLLRATNLRVDELTELLRQADLRADHLRAQVLDAHHETEAAFEDAATHEATIERVKALHCAHPNSVSAMYPVPLCSCDKEWPCPTIRALDAPGRATETSQ